MDEGMNAYFGGGAVALCERVVGGLALLHLGVGDDFDGGGLESDGRPLLVVGTQLFHPLFVLGNLSILAQYILLRLQLPSVRAVGRRRSRGGCRGRVGRGRRRGGASGCSSHSDPHPSVHGRRTTLWPPVPSTGCQRGIPRRTSSLVRHSRHVPPGPGSRGQGVGSEVGGWRAGKRMEIEFGGVDLDGGFGPGGLGAGMEGF